MAGGATVRKRVTVFSSVLEPERPRLPRLHDDIPGAMTIWLKTRHSPILAASGASAARPLRARFCTQKTDLARNC
jgi:hypothetical protein